MASWPSSSHPTSPRTWRAAPLLRGVSFKLERRERLTLSGRNGSGKTTLLRMLAGETSIDGGQLAFAKDTRIALHDQRPPRDRDLSLRDYVLGGCGDLLALEARLGELEQAMAEGATDAATLDAYARAQARLEHAGGYTWREGVNATLHGLGFRDEHLDRAARDVLRRRADARLARARARRRPRPAAARRADEPPRHRLARVARDAPAVARRRRRARRARPLVPRGGRHRGARARGRPRALLQGHLARVAQGEGGARARARPRDREAGGARSRALERFVTRFRAGTRARQAQSRAKKLEKIDRARRATRATARRSASRSSRRSARAASSSSSRTASCGSASASCCATPSCGSSAASTSRSSAPNGTGKTTLIATLAGERELDGGKLRRGHNVKLGLLSQHAEELGATGHRARGVPARDRAEAERGARAARPLPVQRRGGREAARRALAAASAGGSRSPCSCSPARTC